MISIAIVDDEQMYLDKEKRITEEYFRRKGQECRIELFQDAEWLLCELEEKKFDIYVLDVEMPGRNGLDAARGIRMLYPDPVIIFATNFIDYCSRGLRSQYLSLHTERSAGGQADSSLRCTFARADGAGGKILRHREKRQHRKNQL